MYRRWNEFQGVPNKYRNDTPHVTMNQKGVILLNNIAHESMGSPEAVVLLYDKTNGIIGLKPVDPGAPNAFPVKGKAKFQNRVIHCKPFFRHHEIETDRTLLFNKVETEEDVLLLDLATVTSIKRVSRG